VATLLVLFAVATIGRAFADSVQRDSDSTPGASVPTTGTRLSMYLGFSLHSCSTKNPNVKPGAITWPATSAFFVRHGWVGFFENNVANGHFLAPTTDFELYVDHVEQQSLPDNYSPSPGVFVKLFVINFPNGMTGTHLFQGWWFLDGYFTGGTPGTSVFQLACNLEITFQ